MRCSTQWSSRIASPGLMNRPDQTNSHRIASSSRLPDHQQACHTQQNDAGSPSSRAPAQRSDLRQHRARPLITSSRGGQRECAQERARSGQKTRRGPDRAQRRGPAIARGGPNHQHRHITKGARTHRIERRREGELSPTPRAMMTITLAANRGVRRARLERRGIGVSWNRGRWGPFRVLRARGRSASRNESGPSPRDWELGTEDGFWAWECWWRGGVRAVVSGAGARGGVVHLAWLN